MDLKKIIDEILKQQDKPLSWLALEMEKTYAGFRLSLSNETLKYSDIKKMAEILNVPVSLFFDVNNTQKIKGNYNSQISNSIVSESEAKYKIENEYLKQQITDKEEIIKLLKNK
ncbi:hypothetical protein [Pedobacter cryophilus]|uniref:HTH cro/C1-type domain-containing protein n=1 Tax=Pedobacter cryophilus TaxID=2571271 RepID=A0A4U1BWJ6_9SPHI|nr:hypothetical protein [Pedobacter cryophilus]TKB96872.1 hypothetical protein FA046_12405 [Pedobacter cryophilus]